MARNGSRAATNKQPEPESEENKGNGNLPAVQETMQPPAFLEEYAEDAGKGLSTSSEDNLVPLVYLLQSNSPQCKRGHEKFIKGAEAGDFWLRNSPSGYELQKTDEDGNGGFLFQSCYFYKDWVEWRPNRGGMVARYPTRPPMAEQKSVTGDDGNARVVWQMPSGNTVQETRYHAGFAIMEDGTVLPYTLIFTSTGHQVSRAWMTQMNNERYNDRKVAMWAIVYRITSELRRKGEHSWHVAHVERERYVGGKSEYERGKQLFEDFESGRKMVAEETEDMGDPVVSGGDDNYSPGGRGGYNEGADDIPH